MRIAIVCGAMLGLAACNELPPEPVSGDDLGLHNAGSGADDVVADAGVIDPNVKNGTAQANANWVPGQPSDCELKAKECYVSGQDPELCDKILKSCTPPAPSPEPGCGRDCDAEVRACFAKGVDAKTCDALYHECLGGKAPGDASQPANDPVTECQIAAKSCYAKDEDPTVCDAILAKCAELGKPDPAPAPKPGDDPVTQCKLKYEGCVQAGVDTATCDDILKQCNLL